ncbi:hypothetical protein F5141DRAFT_1002889, partial [Pisolithus sp. B1]
LWHWDDLVKDYFTPRAMMKITPWKDNQRVKVKFLGMCHGHICHMPSCLIHTQQTEIGYSILLQFVFSGNNIAWYQVSVTFA